MNKSYLFISVLLLVLGSFTLILPDEGKSSRLIAEEEVFNEMKMETYYFSADLLADRIINADPEVLIIDVRSKTEFEKAAIPNSINIPRDSLFEENWIGYIDQNVKKNVFYAQNDSLTKQVWLQTRMQGFGSNYMLTGGYDSWVNTILNPKEPLSTDDQSIHHLYQQRLGAKTYFTGESTIQNKTKNKPLAPIKRKKKKMVQGGCS